MTNKQKDEVERWAERVLNKIKRAVCEVGGEEGKNVAIRRAPRRQVMVCRGNELLEVAKTDALGNITWDADVPKEIRDHALSLLHQQ